MKNLVLDAAHETTRDLQKACVMKCLHAAGTSSATLLPPQQLQVLRREFNLITYALKPLPDHADQEGGDSFGVVPAEQEGECGVETVVS